MTHVYIGIGSNIEPRRTHLAEAINYLDENKSVTIEKQSSIYQTKPVGYTDQADFLNMVIHITTSLSAFALLDVCQSIEQELGRRRGIRFGPRTIDLDLLWYGDEKIATDRLIVPHPRMHERAFVLIPLSEIAPELPITGYKRNVKDMAEALSEKIEQDVIKWAGRVDPEDEE